MSERFRFVQKQERRENDSKRVWYLYTSIGVMQFLARRYGPGDEELALYRSHRLLEDDIVGPDPDGCYWMGHDLGFHLAKPVYEGISEMECDLLDSHRCYYDGSSLNAMRLCQQWAESGFDDEVIKNGLIEMFHSLKEMYFGGVPAHPAGRAT